MASVFTFFLRCFFLSNFGYRREKMVIQEIFNKFSYRYTEIELHSYLSPLRYLKNSLLLLWRPNSSKFASGSASFTYDLLTDYYEGNSNYLKALNAEKKEFVFRDNLYNELGAIEKAINTLLLFFVFCLLLPVAVFSSDKAKKSLIMLELVEAALLARLLKKYGCRDLLIFSAFEKDIAFLSYYLDRYLGIKVLLTPSSNPISTLYRNVICDTFIFTAPYQKREYELLKENWIIKNTDLWPPYSFNTIKLNKGKPTEGISTLGILSSGMALREHLKHPSEYDKKDFMAEAAMISAVKRLNEEGIIESPLIYLHPLEKSKPDYLDFSRRHYKSVFGDNVAFAPFDKPSKSTFDLCSIGISVYSSTQPERLFGGYKTLFAPMGYLKNFFPGNTFDEISIQNYEGLKQMVIELKTMSDDDFFKRFCLEEYRWDAYKLSLNKTND